MTTDDARDAELLELLRATAAAAGAALAEELDWSVSGGHPGQHVADVVVDDAVRSVLDPAPVGVLSEESGLDQGSHAVVVIVDPVDGSTNASLGIPWYATSLCAVDDAGPRVALVRNQATGVTYEATRGGGATRDGVPIRPSASLDIADSIIALNGRSATSWGWRQYRSLGAAALDLCAVASGMLDGFADCTRDSLGVWDYAGAVLMCGEVGAHVLDAEGRDLIVLDPTERRTPVAAGTEALLAQLLAARNA
jgi:fructose-1,6-bisphosphatase/inositol monophosphatase family enzyme